MSIDLIWWIANISFFVLMGFILLHVYTASRGGPIFYFKKASIVLGLGSIPIILLFSIALFNTTNSFSDWSVFIPPSVEPKPDGNLYLYLNDRLIAEKHLGHNEIIAFCRGSAEPSMQHFVTSIPECKEIFYGCGAINCRCDFAINTENFEKVLNVVTSD